MDDAWTAAALLPAAWVLALGAGVLAVLRRWFEPVPHRVAAVFALVLCLLFAPVLFGGKVLLPVGNFTALVPYGALPPPEKPTHALQADLIHQITPWQAEVRRALGAGRWPLWNENAGAGMPLMADPQSQAFQPLALAAYVLPLPAGVGVTVVLRVLVALLGTFLLLRRQGLGEPAALVGSLGYGLGGGLMLWFGWPIANAVAWTPAVLYGVARCHRVGGRRDVALLAATTAALLLGGHPETVIQSCGLVGSFAIACALERHRAGAASAPFLARCAAAAALAGLLVAPSIVLQQTYLPRTERAVAVGWITKLPTVAQLRELVPPELPGWGRRIDVQACTLVASHAFGDHERFWGSFNAVEDGSACVGAAVGALALSAVARGRRRRLPQEGFFIGVAAVSALLVIQPPYFNHFLAQLPLLAPSAVHSSHRMVLLLGLAAAYLAACEVERCRRGDGNPRSASVGVVLVILLVAWAYLGHPPPHEVWMPAQRWWLGLQLTGAVLLGAALLLRPRTGAARGAVPWAVAAIVGAELLSLHGGGLTPGPARLFYPLTPALRFVRDNLGGARMSGLGAAFPPNFAHVYGLADVRIDGPARPFAYMELLHPLRPAPLTLENAGALEAPGARLYDLLGVRFLLAAPGLSVPLPLAYRDDDAWVYEHPRPLPRLFLPPTASVLEGGDWRSWTARPRDFGARSLVSEGRPGSPGPRWRARRPRDASLTAIHPEPGRWSARLRSPEWRLLASGIYQDGGWRLLVGGRPQPTILATGPLLGAWVPRGAQRLEVLYRPPGFAFGALLAALAMTAAAAWLLPPSSASVAATRQPLEGGGR